jgi:hypothetical protein
VTTRYLWLGQNIVAELDEDDEVLRRYVHGAGVDEPVAMKAGLHHSDLIGWPSRITLISTRRPPRARFRFCWNDFVGQAA